MKYLSMLFVLLVAGGATAQNQADVYKSGTVVLQEDPQYGAGNDWKQIFGIPAVSDEGDAVEPRKSLAVADDGSAFVGNYDSYTIQKFDPSGRFVKTFGGEGSGEGQFRNRPTVCGVLDNRYVFTCEHTGRLTFFDLDGRYVKTLTLDYMPIQCLPLRDDRIAIVGFVTWSGERARHIVAIKDVTTGEEDIVCSEITENAALGVITLKTTQGHVAFFGSARNTDWVVARTPEGNLAANYTGRPTVKLFSPDGVRTGQFSINVDRVKYPEDQTAQIGVKLHDMTAELGISQQDLQRAMDSVKHPEFLPCLYNLLVDNDGNLLAFVYTDSKEGHRFQAYRLSPEGQLIGKVDLLSDRYNLNLSPSLGAFRFAHGYVYAIVSSKEAGGPTRLMRGRLAAK